MTLASISVEPCIHTYHYLSCSFGDIGFNISRAMHTHLPLFVLLIWWHWLQYQWSHAYTLTIICLAHLVTVASISVEPCIHTYHYLSCSFGDSGFNISGAMHTHLPLLSCSFGDIGFNISRAMHTHLPLFVLLIWWHWLQYQWSHAYTLTIICLAHLVTLASISVEPCIHTYHYLSCSFGDIGFNISGAMHAHLSLFVLLIWWH